jgi:hypothetical protein
MEESNEVFSLNENFQSVKGFNNITKKKEKI